MSAVNNIINKIPKEVYTIGLGVATTAASAVAIQLFEAYSSEFLSDFAFYGFSSLGLAGAVVLTYSAIQLCRKVTAENSDSYKALTAVALGSFFVAVARSAAEHLWEIAPEFLEEYSIAYCIGTNFAFYASAALGFGGVVFTAYAAYRLGTSLLASEKK